MAEINYYQNAKEIRPSEISGHAGKREGSIHNAVSNCAREVGDLEKSLQALREKLEPVLRQVPPTVAKKNNLVEEPPCSLARGIGEQAQQIAVLRGWVDEMLNRLEL